MNLCRTIQENPQKHATTALMVNLRHSTPYITFPRYRRGTPVSLGGELEFILGRLPLTSALLSLFIKCYFKVTPRKKIYLNTLIL